MSSISYKELQYEINEIYKATMDIDYMINQNKDTERIDNNQDLIEALNLAKNQSSIEKVQTKLRLLVTEKPSIVFQCISCG